MDFYRLRRLSRGICILLPFLTFFWMFPPVLSGQNVSDIAGDTFEEIEGRGLVIRTKPIGARVFIDGLERGESPLAMNNLRSGEYHIRLVKEGYRERRFKVVLSASSRMVVSILLEEAVGQVLFNIQKSAGSLPEDLLPFNPVIFAGGENLADRLTAAGTAELPVGYRTIQVRAFGWEDVTRTIYVREGKVQVVDITLSPAPFALTQGAVSRARFNPGNAGSLGLTEFRFEVSAPGRGTITITDREGETVYTAGLGPFRTWSQKAVWNGRGPDGNPLPEGIYRVLVETESLSGDDSAPVSRTLTLQTEIDSSINIYPLSLHGGMAGLLFAPAPGVLPRGSFQIEAGLFFGKTAPGERAFSSLPFDAAVRFSPLDRLEITAVLNSLPKFGGPAVWGVSGSAKWVFLHGQRGFPPDFAAGLSYAWEEERGAAPFGAGPGLGLHFPLSWRRAPFTLLFSPGIRWPVQDDLIPRLLLSGGLLFQGPWFTAGLSLRPEFDFSAASGAGNGDGPVFLLTGGEFKLYPPPSNLVFTLSGGAWLTGSAAGGFGGVGVGIIY
ncbi:MAG: PEGA domain-containing protein [Treponema sp.]|jgi:hypothetical protein|nr:PEGA domain-containing protein [Treponema sp.]